MAAPMVRAVLSPFKVVARGNVMRNEFFFSTSRTLQGDPLKSRMLRKMFNKRGRKKSGWFAPLPVQSSVDRIVEPVKRKSRFSAGMKRRAEQISVILYDHIAQIINAGELGVYVQLAKVIVIPDMSHVHVYWESSGDSETDENMQKQLEASSGKLRHFLKLSHAMGHVPKVVFIKDENARRQRELEKLLEDLDVGSDDEKDPDEIHGAAENVTEEVEIEIECKTDQSEDDVFDEIDREIMNSSLRTSDFSQDMYRLQHDVLMEKVMSAKNQSQTRAKCKEDTPVAVMTNRIESQKQMSHLFSKKILKKSKVRNVRKATIDDALNDEDYYSGYER